MSSLKFTQIYHILSIYYPYIIHVLSIYYPYIIHILSIYYPYIIHRFTIDSPLLIIMNHGVPSPAASRRLFGFTSSAVVSAAWRPKTTRSSRELAPRRLAPCTEAQPAWIGFFLSDFSYRIYFIGLFSWGFFHGNCSWDFFMVNIYVNIHFNSESLFRSHVGSIHGGFFNPWNRRGHGLWPILWESPRISSDFSAETYGYY